MRKIEYTSKFTEGTDLVSGANLSRGTLPPETLPEAYKRIPELDLQLATAADKWSEANHYPPLEETIEKDLQKPQCHEIESVCGDDEVVTTDSASYGPLKITAGVVISRIRLSKKDSGISRALFNYTEGWILSTPTRESCYEAVARRHQREGIPFVLDGVRLKFISAVRKQSLLELDLESKFKKVIENASWVHRSHFTYDYHQMMIILAANIFDFRDARSFPYLYTSEGGCGGLPPYGNMDTAISAIHHFHKGRASRTILGLMQESHEIHSGNMRPSESFFLRSSHIAQLGDKAWELYNSVYQKIKEGKTNFEADHILSVLAGKDHLPDELLEKGAEIEPDDVVVGAAISHLRSDKFIMTELDVKLQLENIKKIRALGGSIPYRQILEDIDKEKEKIKSNSWTVLGTIAKYFDTSGSSSKDVLGILPEVTDYVGRRMILQRYYELRTEKFAQFTAFSYSDAIRVFRTSDVAEYVRKKGNVLRADIAIQVDSQLRSSTVQDIVQERLRKEKIFQWIDSDHLNRLLHEPLPSGIGPDDGRLLKQAHAVLADRTARETERNPVVFFLLSGDKQLSRGIRQSLQRRFRHHRWAFVTINPAQYIGLCLKDCQRIVLNEPTFEEKKNVKIYNYLTNQTMGLPAIVLKPIRQAVHGLGAAYYSPAVLCDFPNLERSIEPTTFDPSTNSVSTYYGGFLNVESVRHFSPLSSWAAQPLSKISRSPDFNLGAKSFYPLQQVRGLVRGIVSNRAPSLAAIDSIRAWIPRIQSNPD